METKDPTALEAEGRACYDAGDYDHALERFRAAQKAFVERGDQAGVGEMWNNIGVVYYRRRQWRQAEEALLKASQLAEESENPSGKAKALGNLGSLYARRGLHAEAANHLNEAVAIFRQIGDQENAEATLRALANLSLKRANWLEAILQYERQLAIVSKPTLWQRLQRWMIRFVKRLMRLP